MLFQRLGVHQNLEIRQPRAKVFFGLSSLLRPLSRKSRAIHTVEVYQVGRFGNAYIQVAHAISVAMAVGAETVVVNDTSWLRSGPLEGLGLELISMTRGKPSRAARGPVLTGKFFYSEEFPGILSDEIPESVARAIFIASEFQPQEQTFADDVLVIHLRGGDVFEKPAPRHYGQPPLAFYQKVVQSREWSEVGIVHEDLRNPVLGPLTDFLREKKLRFWQQSGALNEDVGILFKAQYLVCANGSFGRAIVNMSPNLRKYFRFEGTYPIPSSNPRAKETVIRDSSNQYRELILSGNWQANDDQIALMLTQPVASLEIAK